MEIICEKCGSERTYEGDFVFQIVDDEWVYWEFIKSTEQIKEFNLSEKIGDWQEQNKKKVEELRQIIIDIGKHYKKKGQSFDEECYLLERIDFIFGSEE